MLLISVAMFVAIWLVLTRTRIGLIIQAALTHPRDGRGARPQRAARVHARVRRRHALAGLAGVIGGNCVRHRAGDGRHHGADRVRRRGVRRPGLARRRFIASLLIGLHRRRFAVVLDYSLRRPLSALGVTVDRGTPVYEVLTLTLPQIGAAAALPAAGADPDRPAHAACWGRATHDDDAGLRAAAERRAARLQAAELRALASSGAARRCCLARAAGLLQPGFALSMLSADGHR